ncbi:MAG TPA: protein-glutamate O-methyltransferase CheR [Candidatus Acidoferrum sp.]|nr:protein-glutamate O-methyltransferase CheR [Candidatus Acidoferrum sp.]
MRGKEMYQGEEPSYPCTNDPKSVRAGLASAGASDASRDGAGVSGRLEAEAFEGLRTLVLGAGGIDLNLYKDKCVLRRITLRQRSCGTPSLRAYLTLVSKSPVERSRLVKSLTIHVSQFFRNPTTFRAIQDSVLPHVVAAKKGSGGRALRLWSVGCASGEEPYSLAMLLLQTGGWVVQQRSTVIYATDIDPESLSHARDARYTARSLANVPSHWRQRYFVQDGDGFRVVPTAQNLVFFKRHNILDPLPFRRIDLVTCRNVLIYMTEALQERVLLSLHEALNPGGFLILGKVEGLAGAARDVLEPVDVAERIYCKPDPVAPCRS